MSPSRPVPHSRGFRLSAALAFVIAGAIFGGPAQAAPTYSARTLRAEGDAQAKAGHPGRAIVAYERARLLVPRAPGLDEALASARAATAASPPHEGWARHELDRVSASEWSWAALAGLALAAGGLVALGWGARRPATVLMVLGVSCTALFGAAAVMVATPANRAIVVEPGAVARVAPFDAAEPVFSPPEGCELSIERVHLGHALVRDGDAWGWLPLGQIETILPARGA